MQKETKYPAIALLIGVFLMFVTIILHPVGGDLDYLQKIASVIKVSHGLAILSLPFSVYGYWGLTHLLKEQNHLSIFGFIVICFGYVAVLQAATINGFVLPIFIEQMAEINANKEVTSIILNYNFSVNQAYDLIFIWANCLAFLSWSIVMLKSKIFSVWTAYLGIAISASFIIFSIMGFNLINVLSLRYFVAAIILWTVFVAFQMLSKKNRSF